MKFNDITFTIDLPFSKKSIEVVSDRGNNLSSVLCALRGNDHDRIEYNINDNDIDYAKTFGAAIIRDLLGYPYGERRSLKSILIILENIYPLDERDYLSTICTDIIDTPRHYLWHMKAAFESLANLYEYKDLLIRSRGKKSIMEKILLDRAFFIQLSNLFKHCFYKKEEEALENLITIKRMLQANL